jgi:hypothetical protein
MNTKPRVVITQSSYLPWRGWFSQVASADVLVIYDTVQFTKRDWRSRNRIRNQSSGWSWLSIPIKTKGRYEQTIYEAEVTTTDWAAAHLKTIHHTYSKYPGFNLLYPSLEETFASFSDEIHLSKINTKLVKTIFESLNIDTQILHASDIPHSGSATEKLVSISKFINAGTYVSGPAAKDYLDTSEFSKQKIEVEFFDYSNLPRDENDTVDGNSLSIIDSIFRSNSESLNHLLFTK